MNRLIPALAIFAALFAVSAPTESDAEPYAGDVVFQDCVDSGEGYACSFHADGSKFYVFDNGRTPQTVITKLERLLPGDPIAVKGDLLGVFDSIAEVTLYDVSDRPPGPSDQMLGKLQGYWYSLDDAKAQFNILGAERENQYDGQIGALEYLSVRPSCDQFSGAGPYLYARAEGADEGLCYAIDRIDALEMTLIYLPRGNTLRYRRLD